MDQHWEFMPTWARLEIQQLEEDLADGFMSFTNFNRAMEELEEELYGTPYGPDDR